MRDISRKVTTFRTAVARATLKVSPDTIVRIRNNDVPKGDPLPVAKVAAIQAAKNTSQIIPYCHQIALEFVGVEYLLEKDTISIETTVKATERTGVEMEALTAASVAALTIYDMCKMFDESAEIEKVTLVKKTGGKSDFKPKGDRKAKAAVYVMSDRISAGTAKDQSGQIIVDRLGVHNVEVVEFRTIPDEEAEIVESVRHSVDELKVDLVITTGGTGLGPRDSTPESLSRLIDKPLPGVSEALRAYGQDRNPYAMLSRANAGLRKQSVIVSLPGSKGGVEDGLDVLLPAILHAIPMVEGKCHDKQKQAAKAAIHVGEDK
ncbi:MAG: bifunctional molybdenum cofactor biosynthesis protein MoaC/MoaB [Candidatus Obscuribacterales bacterium]|nr:bifunctional molybdenum cofactor biosynthesis protein MoaC/MoaB [Candidatus Obscuribacterales bacterium]